MAGKLKIFTDGASRGNPGEAGIGVIIYDQNNQIILEYGEYIGQTTNNVAEYQALIKALEEARTLGAEEIEVFADSELMVKQINGQYQVKSEGLIPLFREAKGLIKRFAKFKLSHVLRGANKKADQLANEGTDCKGVVKRSGAKDDQKVIAEKSSSPAPIAGGDYPEVEVKPGITRKTLAIGPSLMVIEFKFKKGAEVPRHQHIHEQISYVVKGKLKFLIEGQEFIVNSGESIAIAGQVEHSVVALKDTLDIDVFSPIREDFLEV